MKVSVGMSVFNGEDYVAAAIDSILAQDMQDFECIAIDDGSQDDTAGILAAYDSRLRVISLPANANHGVALNVGIAAAQGSYIAILDADDVAFPQRLSVQAGFLDANSDVDILGTRGVRVAQLLEREIDRPLHPTDDATIKARLLLMNGSSMLHPTTMIRSTFIRENNLWYLPRKFTGGYRLLDQMCRKRRKVPHPGAAADLQAQAWRQRDGGRQAVWEPEKISLQVELLGMYFRELTGSEVHSLAVLMGGGRSFQLSQICAAIAAGNKALLEQRSLFGESKSHLRSILQKYLAGWRTRQGVLTQKTGIAFPVRKQKPP